MEVGIPIIILRFLSSLMQRSIRPLLPQIPVIIGPIYDQQVKHFTL